ncbi:MAG: signal transduction histidine kinase [Granulosicoccus sp.]|jgi:signal transduction histidine kinase
MTDESETMGDLAYYLRISNHLAGKLDIRSALRSVKSEIDQILPLDHLDVCLIDEDRVWNTSYEVGMKTGWSKSKTLVSDSPVRDILMGRVSSMMTANAMKDRRYVFDGALCEPIFQHRLKSRINVSMKVLGKTIGSLNCSSQEENLYNDENISQVKNMADVLAPYFYAIRATASARREALIRGNVQIREEGLRQGALGLTEALERERQRIGMDLHDQTLADLTRIARDIAGVVNPQDLCQLQLRVQDCIQGLRDIIDTSIPAILELFGFQHAVKTHMDKALSSQPATKSSVIDLTENAIDRLPDTIRISLFRITQEAVNNAVQHSKSSHIEVKIERDRDSVLWITVRDDGQSNAALMKNKAPGGLMHMRTRARLIGAEFEINDQNGTCISVCLPTDRMQVEDLSP